MGEDLEGAEAVGCLRVQLRGVTRPPATLGTQSAKEACPRMPELAVRHSLQPKSHAPREARFVHHEAAS